MSEVRRTDALNDDTEERGQEGPLCIREYKCDAIKSAGDAYPSRGCLLIRASMESASSTCIIHRESLARVGDKMQMYL